MVWDESIPWKVKVLIGGYMVGFAIIEGWRQIHMLGG